MEGPEEHHGVRHRDVDERFSSGAQPVVVLAHPVALRQPREGVRHDPAVRSYEKSKFMYNALRRSPNAYHNGRAITYKNSFPKAIGERKMDQPRRLGRSELAVAHRMVRDGVSSVVITRDGKVEGIVNRLDLYAAIVGLE